jgi:hypothetical protein
VIFVRESATSPSQFAIPNPPTLRTHLCFSPHVCETGH